MAPNTPDRKTDHYTASHPDDLPQAADYTVQQPLHLYTEQDHQTWRTLYARQAQLLNGRACDEYLRGLQQLRMSHERVPDFNALNEILREVDVDNKYVWTKTDSTLIIYDRKK